MQGPWPETDKVTTGSDVSGWRVYIMPPCRSLRPEEVLTKGKGNLEWITEVEDDVSCGLKTSHSGEGCSLFH